MHEQRTNSIGQCMYMYLCTVSSEGSMSSMKDQLYGNSTCTKSSQKNTFTEDNTQRVGTSNQWPVQTCT